MIGEIQKIAKSNPAVAQWLSASLGALVNHGFGKSPITGATEAQYGTKWNYAGALFRVGVGTSRIAVKTTSGETITEFSPYVGNPSALDQVTTKPVSFSDRVSNPSIPMNDVIPPSSYRAGISDSSVPMDDIIPPGPGLTESSNLPSPVVLKSEDYKLYNLPPDIDNQTGQISVWDNEKQQYIKTNTYEFGGIKVNDLGGYDEFNRAIFTEVGTGNLVYGINKYGVTLYRGSDGSPNWHLVIPENNFAKIGKLDGTSFERLNITTGDLDMLRDPSATAIFDPVNSRIINSNTGNPLSNIGYKNFKNNISLNNITRERLDNLKWNDDKITVSYNNHEGKDIYTIAGENGFSKNTKYAIVDAAIENSLAYQASTDATSTDRVLRWADYLSSPEFKNHAEKSMRSTVSGIAYSKVGEITGEHIANKMVPQYVRPYSKGIILGMGREVGGHSANTFVLINNVQDNYKEFYKYPDLFKAANDLDKEAFWVGETVSAGEKLALIGSGGRYAVTAGRFGIGVNLIEGIRVEKGKDELKQEKEKREKDVK